ncbi:tRNA (adenosine(37)-N6)-threonylcarbamoyltransferase complex ATPase subunit type 1 TsaE [Roseobacter sinensis]|uniref:tRNA threonylcarbamoyladenosine biosynthesis protein TsaE n=1 Tax=Roseobacter sinensis TaxID=2931391 RepID=A0ABT3B8U2_9RHOB|nr:tRNA (adenosine(37)-N6)-threonylcarbamoyltransferase complex ATPase subunit type 1 TsaE [Roseobacter sp. WL0113]MCV3269991.1 tRNA (adenosine(37)-N6)-threonylcarbamoyltransferase complex ATPase subunit type 1 TsaE [Roseobacter sp. WL0113]
MTLNIDGSDATARFAAALGAQLHPGDTVLLNGPVGAGKTHLARHLIQSILPHPEDIPSPTFTIVQTYETTRGPLWHADLYRIGTVDEVEELGLADAFETAICLVEWPDRLGALRPDGALEIWLDAGASDNDRILRALWQAPQWQERLKTAA